MELGTGWIKSVKPGMHEVHIWRERRDDSGRFRGLDTTYYRECDTPILTAAMELEGQKVITASELLESGGCTLVAIQHIHENHEPINALIP